MNKKLSIVIALLIAAPFIGFGLFLLLFGKGNGGVVVGETATYQVRVEFDEPEELTAIAFRAVYPSEDVVVKDFVVEESLAKLGWNFPVYETSSENNTMNVDFAATYLNPEGYSVADEMVLGVIEIQGKDAKKFSFSADKELSKVINKAGEEIEASWEITNE